MSDNEGGGGAPHPQQGEPILLLPQVVAVLAGLLVLIHVASMLVLDEDGRIALLTQFSFFPLRITAAFDDPALGLPLLWTPFTHALLHDGWEHLLVNTAWLLIFGTPVARRYGTVPTVLIFAVTAAAGAFAFALNNLDAPAFLIGASGGVSGLTGAAVRFIFQPTLFISHPETGERIVLGRRLALLKNVLREPPARAFILIWLGLNAAVPILSLFTGGLAVQIAWQAHIGGFLAGMLMVGLFERRARQPRQ